MAVARHLEKSKMAIFLKNTQFGLLVNIDPVNRICS